METEINTPSFIHSFIHNYVNMSITFLPVQYAPQWFDKFAFFASLHSFLISVVILLRRNNVTKWNNSDNSFLHAKCLRSHGKEMPTCMSKYVHMYICTQICGTWLVSHFCVTTIMPNNTYIGMFVYVCKYGFCMQLQFHEIRA